MITLTLEAVKAAARQAYAEGRLSAQAPNPVCEYRSVQDGKTYACGIGCAMTDEQVAELVTPTEHQTAQQLNWASLSTQRARWTSDDNHQVLVIQRAHDQWACSRMTANYGASYGASEINRRRVNFLRLIDIATTPEAQP